MVSSLYSYLIRFVQLYPAVSVRTAQGAVGCSAYRWRDRVWHCDQDYFTAGKAGICFHGNSTGNGKLECDSLTTACIKGSKQVHTSNRSEYTAHTVWK